MHREGKAVHDEKSGDRGRRNRAATSLFDGLFDVARANFDEYVSYWDRVYDEGRDGEYKADDWSNHAAEFWTITRNSVERLVQTLGVVTNVPGRVPHLVFVIDAAAEVTDPQPIPLPSKPDALEIGTHFSKASGGEPIPDVIHYGEVDGAFQVWLANTLALESGRYDGLIFVDRGGQKRLLAHLTLTKLP